MKKVFSIFLSALLLFGSTGFTLSNHYCEGSLEKVNIGFSSKDLSCEMMKEKDACPLHSSSNQVKDPSCCSNQFIHFALEEDFEKEAVKETELNPTFLIAYTFITAGFNPFVKDRDFNLLYYTPPLLDKDIPVLIQSFLI